MVRTACHLCGKELSQYSLDHTRLLECGMCVQAMCAKKEKFSEGVDKSTKTKLYLRKRKKLRR